MKRLLRCSLKLLNLIPRLVMIHCVKIDAVKVVPVAKAERAIHPAIFSLPHIKRSVLSLHLCQKDEPIDIHVTPKYIPSHKRNVLRFSLKLSP